MEIFKDNATDNIFQLFIENENIILNAIVEFRKISRPWQCKNIAKNLRFMSIVTERK